MSESPSPFEWGQLLQKVDTLIEKTDEQSKDIMALKKTMSTGWGILIGAAAVVGLFANELIDGIKRMISGGA